MQIHLTDTELAALCGMTPQNLRITYKKNPNPIKQRLYEFLKLGAQTWLAQEGIKKKNQELLNIIQNMEPIVLQEKERKGRKIENFD